MFLKIVVVCTYTSLNIGTFSWSVISSVNPSLEHSLHGFLTLIHSPCFSAFPGVHLCSNTIGLNKPPKRQLSLHAQGYEISFSHHFPSVSSSFYLPLVEVCVCLLFFVGVLFWGLSLMGNRGDIGNLQFIFPETEELYLCPSLPVPVHSLAFFSSRAHGKQEFQNKKLPSGL